MIWVALAAVLAAAVSATLLQLPNTSGWYLIGHLAALGVAAVALWLA